jgi:hypothetical protein
MQKAKYHLQLLFYLKVFIIIKFFIIINLFIIKAILVLIFEFLMMRQKLNFINLHGFMFIAVNFTLLAIDF